MANINVVNLEGSKVGEFELDELFAGEVNEALLWESVKHYRASLRQGTHATKNRKMVSGAGKKLWKQKGTGRARVGSIRTPLWRGGGTVHGPQPRSYEYQFPRKKLMGALRSAIEAATRDGARGIVLSGRPGMFSAGLDVPALLPMKRDDLRVFWGDFFGLCADLACSKIPVVAAITGHSPAGGAVLAIDRKSVV